MVSADLIRLSMKILRRKRLWRVLGYIVLAHVVGLLLTHCSFNRYTRKSFERAQKEKPYDVIIVPGIPYDPATSSDVMKMRVYWAKYLYDSGFTRNIIFSGSAVYTPYYEGIVMKAMADSLGIPESHVFSEITAEHSTENIYYSWKMAQEMGFRKIALASDPFQCAMLGRFRKRYTPGVAVIPIVFDKLSVSSYTLPAINDNPAFDSSFVALPDRQSFWERFQGTMGKRVKEEVKDERKTEAALAR